MESQAEREAGPGEAGDGPPDEDWSAYDAVVRLTAGAVGLGLARLKEIDTAIPSPDSDAVARQPIAAGWETIAAVVVGFAADLPDRAERGIETIERSAERFRPLTAPVVAVVRISGVAALTERGTAAVGSRVRAEIERLVELGRDQTHRGERLVEAVFGNSMDGVIDHIADSESLDELVHDQTMGITSGAVREVRETGAAADGLTETIFRRIVRRPERAAPRPTLEGI